MGKEQEGSSIPAQINEYREQHDSADDAHCFKVSTGHFIQGVFFDWSHLNLTKSQSLYEIPYSNFFLGFYYVLVLGLSQI